MSTTTQPETVTAGASAPVVVPAPAAPVPSTGNAIRDALNKARTEIAATGALGPLGTAGTPAVATETIGGEVGAESSSEGANTSHAPPAGPTQGADGLWRNPDGTFAQPPVADIATDGAEGEQVTEGDAAPAPIIVSLPPRNDGEPETEIEVSDPAVAERLRELKNNGMRRAKFDAEMADVAEQRAQLNEFVSVLEHAPEAIVDRMSADNRARVLKYLLASDMDTHREFIAQVYNDDTARRGALVDMREERGGRMQTATARSTAERKADEIRGAVRVLVPETASEQDAQDFYTDAIAYLSQEAHRNDQLSARDVPKLLETRMKRYWGAQSPAPITALGEARPSGAQAEALQKKAATARAVVARTQAAQATRAVAAKVAPQGAGAVPQGPLQPPKGQNLKDRLAWFKQQVSGR